MKKLVVLIAFICTSFLGLAQEKQKINTKDYQNHSVEMADQFRADGKIYVVVAIALVILSVLAGTAIQAERKISRLEKRLKEIKGEESLKI